MRYCVPYSKTFKYKDTIDEMMFIYDEFHNQDIFHILAKEPKPYRALINILDFEYFQKWRMVNAAIDLKNKGVNFALVFNNYIPEMDELISILKENKIQFFFLTRVRDWDTFYGLIDLGVSDIYIVENLGFELNLLGPLAHATSVSIRAFANVCQTSWSKGNSIKTFFIRPEDVFVYEPYIDVLEFFGDQNTQEVVYKVYSKDKKWFGDLREIIVGLNIPLDSRFILHTFGPARVKCGKKCIKGGKCQICDRIIEASKTFQENGIYIKN